jgi:hypothetical protein
MTPNPVMHNSDGVSIRDYIDLRFMETQRAIDKAETSMGERLAGMNEFRGQLKDQTAKFLTRDEAWLMIDPIRTAVTSLKTTSDISKGRSSVASILAALALVVAVIKLFIK